MNKKILLIDDEELRLGGLSDFLEEEGYDLIFNSTVDVLYQLKHRKYDLILLDVMISPIGSNDTRGLSFPGISFTKTGLELYRRLRAGQLTTSSEVGTSKDVPVLFITGGGLDEDVFFDRHTSMLIKPFRIKDLLSAIASLIRDV